MRYTSFTISITRNDVCLQPDTHMMWLRVSVLLISALWNIQNVICAIIYVNSNSNITGTNCGITYDTACLTIAAAFDVALSSDTISIQPGLYTGLGNENLNPPNGSKVGIHLFGNGTADMIIIQCQNENRFLHSENNFITRIDNLSIHNCTALVATIRNIGNGGALSFSDSNQAITIRNSIFVGNRARSGGAIIITSGSLTIISCTFANNQGGYWGGALASVRSGITIMDSVFSGNSIDGEIIVDPKLQLDTAEAGSGGSIHANGGARMTIRGTAFISNWGQVAGGALFAKLVSGLEISNCVFEKNTILGTGLCDSENACHVRGGAIFISDVALTLSNSSFLGNQAITQDLSQVGIIYSPLIFFSLLKEEQLFFLVIAFQLIAFPHLSVIAHILTILRKVLLIIMLVDMVVPYIQVVFHCLLKNLLLFQIT